MFRHPRVPNCGHVLATATLVQGLSLGAEAALAVSRLPADTPGKAMWAYQHRHDAAGEAPGTRP